MAGSTGPATDRRMNVVSAAGLRTTSERAARLQTRPVASVLKHLNRSGRLPSGAGRRQPGLRRGGRSLRHGGVADFGRRVRPRFSRRPLESRIVTVQHVHATTGTGQNAAKTRRLAAARWRFWLGATDVRSGRISRRAVHWPCDRSTLQCSVGRRAEDHERASSTAADSTRGV